MRKGSGRESMPVRSVRLPDELWQKLGDALAGANVGRRHPIVMATLIRILLERGLEHPAGLEEIGSKITRPPRMQAKPKEVTGSSDTTEDHTKPSQHVVGSDLLFEQCKRVILENFVSPRSFVKQTMNLLDAQADRTDARITRELHDFYSGLVKSESHLSNFTVGVLRKWLAQQGDRKEP